MAQNQPTQLFFDTREASAYLKQLGVPLEPATLAAYRCARADGPPFRRLGRRIRYSRADLDAYAEQLLGQVYRSTSDAGSHART